MTAKFCLYLIKNDTWQYIWLWRTWLLICEREPISGKNSCPLSTVSHKIQGHPHKLLLKRILIIPVINFMNNIFREKAQNNGPVGRNFHLFHSYCSTYQSFFFQVLIKINIWCPVTVFKNNTQHEFLQNVPILWTSFL